MALGVAAGLRAGLNEAFVSKGRNQIGPLAGGCFEPHHRNWSRRRGQRVDCRSHESLCGSCEVPTTLLFYDLVFAFCSSRVS